MNKPLRIAAAAEATGLSAYTLRYYEQIGLIAPVDRQGGARRYGEADMRWLAFLVRLRATGMSMKSMQRYAELLRQGQAPENVAERQALLVAHASRVEADMQVLGETLAYIRKKIRGYQDLQALPEQVKSAPDFSMRQIPPQPFLPTQRTT